MLLFLILMVQLFVYSDFILFNRLYLFLDIGSDSYNLFYPGFVHIASYLRTEGLPTWSFAEGMGKNIFAGGINNPFQLILYLIGPERLAFGIVFVEMLKGLITGILFFLYLRIRQFSGAICLFGGILAAFLGYLVLGGSGWYGHSTNVVYFMLLVYAFELCFQKGNWLLLPLAVFFVATNPFRLYIFGVFMLTYVLFRMMTKNEYDWKKSIFFLLRLGGFGLLGIGLSALFSFDNLMGMLNSPRVSGDVSAVGALSASPWWHLPDRLQGATVLMRMFSNDLMGTGSDYRGWYNYMEAPIFYAGLLPLILIPQAFSVSDRRRRIAYLSFLALWSIPLIFPYARHALYAFMGDYYKHGLSMFIPFIILIFGMWGLERVWRHKLQPLVLVFTTAILLIILFYPYFDGTVYEGQTIIDNHLRLIISLFLITYTGLLYAMQYKALKHYIFYMLLLTICIEAAFMSTITVNHRSTMTRKQFESRVGYNDYTLEAIEYLKTIDTGFYRVNKDYSSSLAEINSLNDAKIQGYFGTPSYSSFNSQDYIEFLKATEIIPKGQETKTRWAMGLLQRPLLQALAGVKYNLVRTEELPKKRMDALFDKTYTPMAQFGDITVLKNEFSLPPGIPYDAAINLAEFNQLSRVQKDIILFNACILESDLPGIDFLSRDEIKTILGDASLSRFWELSAQKRSDAMQLTRFTQKRFKGLMTLKKQKLVFFAIPFDEGWQAFDNGARIP